MKDADRKVNKGLVDKNGDSEELDDTIDQEKEEDFDRKSNPELRSRKRTDSLVDQESLDDGDGSTKLDWNSK